MIDRLYICETERFVALTVETRDASVQQGKRKETYIYLFLIFAYCIIYRVYPPTFVLLYGNQSYSRVILTKRKKITNSAFIFNYFLLLFITRKNIHPDYL